MRGSYRPAFHSTVYSPAEARAQKYCEKQLKGGNSDRYLLRFIRCIYCFLKFNV